MRTFRDRLPYTAIVDRPKLALPGGARVAVWVIVNVEEWSDQRPMPRMVLTPPSSAAGALQPDLPNWAWHEYGMRVGFWRLLDALKAFDVRATLAINGSVCTSYPRVAKAALDAGWEFMGHGFVQRPMHHLEDQRAAIRDTIAAIRKLTGRRPRGWESPGLTETFETIDLLAEEGIEYVADWVADDLPCAIRTRKGVVHSIPYTVEMNDIPMMAIQHHASSEWLQRGTDCFDRLYQEGERIPRVMAISVHPYITGVPHRIGYLERLLEHVRAHEGAVVWTGAQILDWYRKATGKGKRRR
jgi:peptidoglycan/xylan/chitin deacetylase (PgdA/CDA1 family)